MDVLKPWSRRCGAGKIHPGATAHSERQPCPVRAAV